MKLKNLLKKTLLASISILLFNSFFAQGVAINKDGTLPDPSAMLDVSASNKGILIPRVELHSITDERTIDNPAIGLLVFNTKEDIIDGKGIGYYYNGGGKLKPLWKKLNENGDGTNWLIGGNDDILNPDLDFLGTTIKKDVVFKMNKDESFRIKDGGALLMTGNKITGQIPASGAGDRLMWIPTFGAFRAGGVSGKQWDKDSVGLYSFAVGYSNKAKGARSFASGSGTSAININSTSMGWITEAKGANTLATGFGTNAEGANSATFGSSTTAGGIGSIAAGFKSYTKGQYAIAMGENDSAIGNTSVAMGNNTIAYGQASTSIGFFTRALGEAGLAAGRNSVAEGNYSFAMGENDSAIGNASTAIGYNNKAVGSRSFASGSNTSAIQVNSTTIGSNTIAKGINTLATGISTTAEGINSATFGNSTTSAGIGSVAAGFKSYSKGQYAIAMGNNDSAIGNASVAMGYNTVARELASTSLGFFTNALGKYSTATGEQTTAKGISATAIGSQTTAEGDYSFAGGKLSNSKGMYSLAIGENCNAYGPNSIVIGKGESSTHAVALGYESYATAESSVAIGGGTIGDVFAKGAIVIGKSVAKGEGSVAIGRKNITEGKYSASIGDSAIAIGRSSIAMGYGSKSIGDFSTAIGRNSQAVGSYSVALGINCYTLGQNAVALGYGSSASALNSFAAGGGASAGGQTAAAVNKGTANGDFSFASGTSKTKKPYSVAMGYNARAEDTCAVAFGDNTYAIGKGAFAAGSLSGANADYSSAIGLGLFTNSYASTVIGSYNDYTLSEDHHAPHEDDIVFQIGNGKDGLTRSNALSLLRKGHLTVPTICAIETCNPSDIRLKENIKPLQNVLKNVVNIQPITYNFKDKYKYTASHKIGFSAQEIEKEFPELVTKNEEGFLAVNYAQMSAVAIEAIKEQQVIIQDQSNTIKTLEERIQRLEKLMLLYK